MFGLEYSNLLGCLCFEKISKGETKMLPESLDSGKTFKEIAAIIRKEGETKMLPESLANKLKMYGRNGSSFDLSAPPLSSLNDSGKTFKEIAAIIRKDPSVYFKEAA